MLLFKYLHIFYNL